MKTKTQDPRIAEKVLEMVAAHYKTTSEALKSDQGDPIAKKVVMYTLKEGLGGSIRSAREAVGKKHDPDVYQAVNKVKGLLKTDTDLASLVEEIKTEALMITAMPGGGSDEPVTNRRQAFASNSQPASLVSQERMAANSDSLQSVEKVQKAVVSVFLGSNLLQSVDPSTDVLLAKDLVVFLIWNDFPKTPLSEILNSFRLDQDGFYRAIGRISVLLREEGGEFKKRLKAARNTYSTA